MIFQFGMLFSVAFDIFEEAVILTNGIVKYFRFIRTTSSSIAILPLRISCTVAINTNAIITIVYSGAFG
jgi:hypothetical protein